MNDRPALDSTFPTSKTAAPQPAAWSPRARTLLWLAVLISAALAVYGLSLVIESARHLDILESLKMLGGVALIALGLPIALKSHNLLMRSGPDTPIAHGNPRQAQGVFFVVWVIGSVVGVVLPVNLILDTKMPLAIGAMIGLCVASVGALWIFRWIGVKFESQWTSLAASSAIRKRASAWSVFFAFVWGIVSAALAFRVELWLVELTVPYLESRYPNLLSPAAIARMLQDPVIIAGLFIGITIVGPIVEEACKAIGLRLCRGAIHSHGDGLLLGLMAGLGFGFIESAGYILGGIGSPTIVVLIWMRAATMIVHSLATGLAGAGYAQARLTGNGWALWRGLLRGILVHGVWNAGAALIILSGLFGFGAGCLPFLVLIVMAVIGVRLLPKIMTAAMDGSIQDDHAESGVPLPREWSPLEAGVWWRVAGGRPRFPPIEEPPAGLEPAGG